MPVFVRALLVATIDVSVYYVRSINNAVPASRTGVDWGDIANSAIY